MKFFYCLGAVSTCPDILKFVILCWFGWRNLLKNTLKLFYFQNSVWMVSELSDFGSSGPEMFYMFFVLLTLLWKFWFLGNWSKLNLGHLWGKVFKNGPSKIYGRQSLKLITTTLISSCGWKRKKRTEKAFLTVTVNYRKIVKKKKLCHLKQQ